MAALRPGSSAGWDELLNARQSASAQPKQENSKSVHGSVCMYHVDVHDYTPSFYRAEIQREQTRRQTSESQLQSKINKQSGEITIFKTKITGLEEELKQTKQLSSSHSLQKLEEVRRDTNTEDHFGRIVLVPTNQRSGVDMIVPQSTNQKYYRNYLCVHTVRDIVETPDIEKMNCLMGIQTCDTLLSR